MPVHIFGTLDETFKTFITQIKAQKDEIEYDSFEEVTDTMIKSIRVGAERTIDIAHDSHI